MDVWATIIAGFKAASPGQVTVLGAASGVQTSTYAGLNVDGFYQTSEATTPYEFLGVGACGYQADGNGNGPNRLKGPNFSAAFDLSRADCQAYCEAHSWCQAYQILDYPCPAPGLPGTTGDGSAWSPAVNVACQTNVGQQDNTEWAYCSLFLKVGTDRDTVAMPGGGHWHKAQWTYAPIEVNVARRGTHDGLSCYKPGTPASLSGTTVVSAIGAPLFDESAVDDATVYVTLAASDIGIWSPFSWYPSVSPTKWAAMVTEATDQSAIATLVDRGYGWIYLTSETGFDTASSMTPAVLTAIENIGTNRRLNDRRLAASAPFWGCDDTLFTCQPICIRTQGKVSTKVADSLCAGAPKDVCACKCYHDARWTCSGDAVVCQAKLGAGELKTVGDMVCETRGAPKPSSTAELRVASTCEPMTEMRGDSPSDQCLAQWATPEPTKAPKTQSPTEVSLLPESFATALALTALALYA
jgi:hypothetical protein